MSLIKNFSRFVAAVTAASLIIAPVAQADRDRGDRGRGDRGGWERRGDDHREHRRDHRRDDWRDHRRDHRDHDRYDYHRHRPVVVYRPSYDYYPRSSVTVTYGSSYGPYYYSGYRPRYDVGHYYSYGPRRTVYINDYHNYGLYEPPHGYHWVRDNDRGDAILASVATGAILGLVIGAIATD
jgi:Ni/Co efflux regulator RcnB